MQSITGAKKAIQLPNNWSPRPDQMNMWTYLERGGTRCDAVSITRIAKARLSEMRWPFGVTLPYPQVVRLLPSGAPITVNER